LSTENSFHAKKKLETKSFTQKSHAERNKEMNERKEKGMRMRKEQKQKRKKERKKKNTFFFFLLT